MNALALVALVALPALFANVCLVPAQRQAAPQATRTAPVCGIDHPHPAGCDCDREMDAMWEAACR